MCWVRAQIFEMSWLGSLGGGPGFEKSLAGAFGRGLVPLGGAQIVLAGQFGGDLGFENSLTGVLGEGPNF